MKLVPGRAWMLAAALSLPALPLAGAPARPEPTPGRRVARRADPMDPERAAALRARATVLMKDHAHFRQAATLLLQSSALTPVEDSARAHLYLAGNLLYYTGELGEAQSLMAQSADAALERGDVEAAASALVNAAWLAAKRRHGLEAREYALRALHLSASPLLSASLRDRIRQRVVVSPAGTVARLSRDPAAKRTGFSVAAERSRTPRGRVRPPARATSPGGSAGRI